MAKLKSARIFRKVLETWLNLSQNLQGKTTNENWYEKLATSNKIILVLANEKKRNYLRVDFGVLDKVVKYLREVIGQVGDINYS